MTAERQVLPSSGRCPPWLEELLGPSETEGTLHCWRVQTQTGSTLEIRCRRLEQETIAFWLTDLARTQDGTVRVLPCRDENDAAWIVGRLRLVLMGQPWEEHPPRPPRRR